MLSQEFIRNALLAGTPIAIAAGRSATSSCCAARCSPATRSATSPSPACSRPRSRASTCASASSPRRSPSRFSSPRSATARSSDDVAIGTSSPGCSGSASSSSTSSTARATAATASSPRARCSARSSASAAARRSSPPIVGALLVVGIAVIARPLLFATIAPRVAAARGVPVGALGAGFLVLVGIDAARGHAGGRRAAPARPDRRPGRRRASADRERLPRARPLRRLRPRLDLARDRARVRDPVAAAEQRDHRRRRRDLRALVRSHLGADDAAAAAEGEGSAGDEQEQQDAEGHAGPDPVVCDGAGATAVLAAAAPSGSPRGAIVIGDGKARRMAVSDPAGLVTWDRWRAASRSASIRLAPMYRPQTRARLSLSMRTNEPVCGASMKYPSRM